MASANNYVFNMWAESLMVDLNGGFDMGLFTGVRPTTGQDPLNPTDNILLTQVGVAANQLERTGAVISEVTSPANWEDDSANAAGIATFARLVTANVVVQLSVGKDGVTYPVPREVLITVPDTLDYDELGIDPDEPYIVAGGFVRIDSLTLTIANAPAA